MTTDAQAGNTTKVDGEMVDAVPYADRLPSKPRGVVLLAAAGLYLVWVGAIFLLVNETELTLGKTYGGLMAAHACIMVVCILIWNPVLIERRARSPIGKKWDVGIVLTIVAMVIAMVVVAVEDFKTRGGIENPFGMTWLIGLGILVAGWLIVTWSMVANPFFEKNVRIQPENGHCVVDSGPYAYIRHPGYVGFSGLLIGTPLLLASAVTAVPALLAVLLFVIRTVFEDRMLQAELPGYREFAERVRYRLIPGVW